MERNAWCCLFEAPGVLCHNPAYYVVALENGEEYLCCTEHIHQSVDLGGVCSPLSDSERERRSYTWDERAGTEGDHAD